VMKVNKGSPKLSSPAPPANTIPDAILTCRSGKEQQPFLKYKFTTS